MLTQKIKQARYAIGNIVKLYQLLEKVKNNWYNKGGIIIEKKQLNLKNDVIFKTFFSRKGNEKYLIDFLESLLNIDIKEIKIQEEVNLEKLSLMEKGRKIRYTSPIKQWYHCQH